MALLVETYEEIETVGAECEVENDAEALELIESLGLDGQRSLNSGTNGKIARFPYRKVTAEEKFVIEMICPAHTKLTSYDAGTIPLRVLQVAAHAKDMFGEIWVCHPKQVVKDPFLIGVKGQYLYSPWSGEAFMLARWGAELAPWSELCAKAASVYRDKFKAAIASCRAKLAGVNIDEIPDSVLCSGETSVPDVLGMRSWS